MKSSLPKAGWQDDPVTQWEGDYLPFDLSYIGTDPRGIRSQLPELSNGIQIRIIEKTIIDL
ncbi:hypothetical protein ADIS_3751 [Lunatimonas lonarensis]|uniref:Uncharacterized protein n=1 Tax=Lunatimonas lonarensis TaxID=1232681 RepID=R7ZP26_9BACT|nr:hypothetical protein [Lunatimonas lonarensis]EON75860.1 hypothetical protein ADIS_3751 [Lunatimonas lonarensis]